MLIAPTPDRIPDGAKTSGRKPWLRTCATLGAVLMTLAASSPAPAADPAPQPTPGGLTVAILDLDQAPGLMPVKPAAPPPPSWRTSFGSQRQSEQKAQKAKGPQDPSPLAAIADADADAVLIQGVKAAAPLRRLFPARNWRLIVSRRIISPDDPSSAPPTDLDARPAVTAIAIKAQGGIRVTARELTLDLGTPGSEPALGKTTAAATAVRLTSGSQVIWLVSIALSPDCDTGGRVCTAGTNLETWRKSKRGDGAMTLVGGRLGGGIGDGQKDGKADRTKVGIKAGPPSPCSTHRIDSDVKSRIIPPPAADPAVSKTAGAAAEGTGCVTIVRLGE